MERVGTSEAHRFEIVAFQNIEHLQCGDALSVRRKLVHFVAAVIGGNGLDPLRLMRGEILLAQITTVGVEEGIDLFGDFTFVKSIASLLSEQTIGVGEIGISKDVSFGWRSPI